MEEIKAFLESQGWIYDEADHTFSRTIELPGRVVVVNGRQIPQPSNNTRLTIKYIGEGSISGSSSDEELLTGWTFQEEDIWVYDLEDFKRWYVIVYKNLP